MKFSITLIVILFYYSQIYAQPANSGCLMPDNTFLTNSNFTTTSGSNYRYNYVPSPSYNRFCTSSAASYVRLGSAVNAPSFNINCGTSGTYAGNSTGVMYYYTLLQCPLDRYSMLLTFPIALLAFKRVRDLAKRNT